MEKYLHACEREFSRAEHTSPLTRTDNCSHHLGGTLGRRFERISSSRWGLLSISLVARSFPHKAGSSRVTPPSYPEQARRHHCRGRRDPCGNVLLGGIVQTTGFLFLSVRSHSKSSFVAFGSLDQGEARLYVLLGIGRRRTAIAMDLPRRMHVTLLQCRDPNC